MSDYKLPSWASEINDSYTDIVRIDEEKFVVFIDKRFEVDWLTSNEYDKELEGSGVGWAYIGDTFARIRLFYSTMPSYFSKETKLGLSMHLGEALVSAFYGTKESTERILSDAQERIVAFCLQESRRLILDSCAYVLTIQSALLLALLANHHFRLNLFFDRYQLLFGCFLVGGVGALTSMILKMSDLGYDKIVRAGSLRLEVFFKVITGSICAVVLFYMIKAGIFPLAKHSNAAIIIFAFIAGFIERFVPALISKHATEPETKPS